MTYSLIRRGRPLGRVCYLSSVQPQHTAATTFVGVCLAQNGRLITTNYILAELVALLTGRALLSRAQVVHSIDTLKASPHVSIVHIDPTLDAAAWKLLKARQDKEWSLVDCASFVVMQQLRLTQALTTDHHFEQAGFVPLLTP
ncbi:MAG: PIN domain-containing protein [Armatimonadota bacterium]|nr:PIN domain-containing protein [Armatimonadota bacterium]